MKTNHAASMLLRTENEPESLARERYEELKSDLEGIGYVESGRFIAYDDIIVIGYPNHIEAAFSMLRSDCYYYDSFGPLIKTYNPELLCAIAANGMYQGEPKEGQYWADKDGAIYKVIGFYGNIIRLSPVGVNGECGIDLREFKQLPYHLATVEELIEAFGGKEATACEEKAQVEPDTRKIRKGDLLKRNYTFSTDSLTSDKIYEAQADAYHCGLDTDVVKVRDDSGFVRPYHVKCFTIVEPTESQPAPDSKAAKWNEVKEQRYFKQRGVPMIQVSKEGIYLPESDLLEITSIVELVYNAYQEMKENK